MKIDLFLEQDTLWLKACFAAREILALEMDKINFHFRQFFVIMPEVLSVVLLLLNFLLPPTEAQRPGKYIKSN